MNYKIKKHGSGYYVYEGRNRITTTISLEVAKDVIKQHKKWAKIEKKWKKQGYGLKVK